ncbi:binding-protein-dependent transport systems inner membrane component [Solidesulfovibrio carbinoliphilus subsp. oakridgensis]|uniref:Binding-protein-dependent transport systems inner membrane component n=1 Tax=Solidesulfovibrio carbinoliphilus subsp. oakridgensis TaxID=694327 RepID=G7Q583_9BACT|nr:binding-protein-dependent transport systems inner membrane component [Solidesulfovibrio carbinoliphilus subsp. oakridgensis]
MTRARRPSRPAPGTSCRETTTPDTPHPCPPSGGAGGDHPPRWGGPGGAKPLLAAGGILLLCLLLATWELTSRFRLIRPDLLPPVSEVLVELGRLAVSGELARQGLATLLRVLGGFAAGGVFGVAFGFACGVWPGLGRASRLTVEFLRPMPSVALIPIGILFLGLGFGLCVAVAGFACAWPAYVAALAGSGAAGAELRATARVYGLTRGETIVYVLAPAAAPQVMAGLRVALAVAVAVTVTTEMAASPDGLGSFILESSLSRRPEAMYAGIVAVGLLGFLLNAAFVAARRRLLRWLPEGCR